MYRFWKTIIRPVLEEIDGPVVEVGAYEGANTRNLLEHCAATSKQLDVIDPKPLFDVETLTEKAGYSFNLHQANSLEVLPQLKELGSVLIDGDHNWYTVYHELLAIDENHPDASQFPVLFFHDVNWPYARRDLYYQPETIPKAYRHPYKVAGIKYGEQRLSKDYHFNDMLANATHEGGPKNGVLTAVEDFIEQSKTTFEWLNIPAYHGLGILVSKAVLEKNERLKALWKHFNSQSFAFQLLGELEALRADQVAELIHEKEIVQRERHQVRAQAESTQGFRSLFKKKSKPQAPISKGLVDDFIKAYYDSLVWLEKTQWLGANAKKFPTDMWVYQELIYDLMPDLIIETGTFDGGSTLFLASMLDLVNNGEIVSVDISIRDTCPQHPRITYLEGSSVAPDIVEQIKERSHGKNTVLVILDSDHTKTHVLSELHAYKNMVTVGSYLIVEDTIANGHPVLPDYGPGPMEAVEAFLPNHPEFEVDYSQEKFLLTTNKMGYLKKIK